MLLNKVFCKFYLFTYTFPVYYISKSVYNF